MAALVGTYFANVNNNGNRNYNNANNSNGVRPDSLPCNTRLMPAHELGKEGLSFL